jgi:hypothetical protein
VRGPIGGDQDGDRHCYKLETSYWQLPMVEKKLVNPQGFRTQDEKYRSARSVLVVVGGLPATGKSTIAGTLAVAKCGKPHSRGGSGPDLGPIRASRVRIPAHQQLGNILRP